MPREKEQAYPRKRKRRLSLRFYMFLVIFIGVTAAAVVLALKSLEPKNDTPDPNATQTPIPRLTPAPTNTPKPALPDAVGVVRAGSADPAAFGFETLLQVDGEEARSYSRAEAISFPRDIDYNQIPGITTFGGNNYRSGFSYGTASVKEKRLKKVAETATGALGTWAGTGWTGQPLIVEWPAETRQHLPIGDGFKTAPDFTEVIYPAMDGNIYFFDLASGKQSRTPINNGIVNKGTACLDPRGYPILYVGQGIPVKNEKGNSQAYVRVYNLLTNELMLTLGGYDYFSRREWQAFDASPLVTGDTLLYGGENGVLYSTKLNATYDAASGELSINPERLVKYRYEASGYSKSDAPGARWYGIESSLAGFRNYVFFSDNGGRLQCVDINTMKLQYVTDLTDETDSSPVLEESYDDSTVYLYTGSQTSSYDPALGEGYGYTYHRKINALTGAILWENKWIAGMGDNSTSGGTVATPAIGKGYIDHLVIYAISQTALEKSASAAPPAPPASPDETPAPTPEPVYDDGTGYTLGGRVVAYHKLTGEVIWTIQQESDYWASPVLIYDETYRAYLVLCDRSGHMKLFDASNGNFLFDLDLGSRIDSTPAAFNDTIVVGTRGKGGSGDAAKIMFVKVS